jgi:3-deoxy-D-manno-octulosonic-acid transferase
MNTDRRPPAEILYNLLIPAIVGAGYTASLFHNKLREAIAGRAGWQQRWSEAAGRFARRPVWFHVSSVGEFEQARPVITALARERPDAPVAVSFSSPSGLRFARRKEALDDRNNIKFIDYLPVDFSWNTRFCLDRLHPQLVVLVKFDLWPNLIWESRRQGVPVVLIDGTLSPSSHRLSAPGQWFYRSIYASLNKIIAISDSDAARFRSAVPDHPSITVAGDTRFDRVMDRKRQARPVGFDVDRTGRRIVIAGSTWPRDEERLLPALAAAMKEYPDMIAIIAPHEPEPERIAALAGWAGANGLSHRRVSDGITVPPPRVILIDAVGILAEVYRMADIAYVGGGFSTGVHSVIEPAVEGLPVLFGPVHDNSFEALRLIEAEAAFPVRDQADMRNMFRKLLEDGSAREAAGARARRYVESQLGATEKCVEAIAEYL